MSTKLLDSNKKNPFVIREGNHSFYSTTFAMISFIIAFVVLVIASINTMVVLIVFTSIIFFLLLAKLILQIVTMISFNKLIKKIEIQGLSFYITKQWHRRRQSSIWLGATALYLLSYFILVTLAIYSWGPTVATPIMTATFIIEMLVFFWIMITAYLNVQLLDSNLKYADRKLNMHTVEWVQVKAEQKRFYRMVLAWTITITTVVPLLFMISPRYRKWLDKVVKKA